MYHIDHLSSLIGKVKQNQQRMINVVALSHCKTCFTSQFTFCQYSVMKQNHKPKQ